MTNTQWLPVQNFQPLQLCLLNGQAFNNYAQGTCSSPTACGLGMPSPVMQHLQQHGQPFSHNQLLSPMQQQSPYNLVPNQPVIPALYQHRHVANQSGDIQGVQPSLSSTCPTALGHTLPIPRQGLCTDACASIDGDVLPGSRCTSGGHYNGDSAARVVFPISAEVEHPCSAVPQTDDMQEDVTARSNSEPTMEKFLSDFEDLVHGHQEHLRDIRSSHSETERSQRIRFGHNEIRFLEEECHGCTVMAKPATATNDVPMNKQRKMQMRKFDTVPDLSTEKPLRSILRGSSRHASQEVKSHALFDVLEDGKDVGQLNTAEANTGSQGTAGSEPVEPKDLQSGRRRKPNIDFLAQQMMRRREAAIQARKARGDTNQKLITSAPDFSARMCLCA